MIPAIRHSGKGKIRGTVKKKKKKIGGFQGLREREGGMHRWSTGDFVGRKLFCVI